MVSYEAPQFGQGLLTYSLLLGMKGGSLHDKELVDVSTLFNFAADRVPELARRVGGVQRPVMASPRGGNSFYIGLLSEKHLAAIPLQAERPLFVRSSLLDQTEGADVLELGHHVDDALAEEAVRDRAAPLGFLPAGRMHGAFRISGMYTTQDGTTTVRFKLWRDKEAVTEGIEVVGTAAELPRAGGRGGDAKLDRARPLIGSSRKEGFRMRKLVLLALPIAVVAVVAGGLFVWRERKREAPPPPPEHVTVANDTFALLVGCTEYPALKEITDPEVYESVVKLLGPANDAALLHSVLGRYLGVPEGNMRLLAGWPDDPEARPTRANILGHLDRLAGQVTEGARVFFLFAGHGAQQPDLDAGDEADGQDEVLLPADAGVWDPEIEAVAGIITDDEIRERLLALRDAGATVLAVFDCCHSGTMMRGEGAEAAARTAAFGEVRLRSLPPSVLGIPVRPRRRSAADPVPAARPRGSSSSAAGVWMASAAIYAARSWEQAPEMVLPRRRLAADREHHGLCSFQIARALQHHGGSLTIAEILARVRAAYTALPWKDATPAVEGDQSLRVLPGEQHRGAALLLRREERRLILDAGSLRGLTVGSSPRGLPARRFRGPSGVAAVASSIAEVEPLCSSCGALPDGPGSRRHSGRSSRGGRRGCARRSPVAAGAGGRGGSLAPRRGREARLRAHRSRRRDSSVLPARRAASRRTGACRPYRVHRDGTSRFLVAPGRKGAGIEPLEVSADELGDVLERIRRAESLRGWAQSGPLSRLPKGLEVEARVRRFGAEAAEPLEPGADVVPGDQILLRLANGTGHDLQVVLENLDAAQFEHKVWPPNVASEPISRHQKAFTPLPPMTLTDEGFGRESLLLVIAVVQDGAPSLDMEMLSGRAPDVEADIARQHGERAVLDTLALGGAQARGGSEPAPASVAMAEISWRTTWGSLVLHPSRLEDATTLEPPLAHAIPGVEGTPPRGDGAALTWQQAVVVPARADCADVLLLAGADGEAPPGAFAVLVDEDGDARLHASDAAESARRAMAGELPLELMIVFRDGAAWAAYPRGPGDRALGRVCVRSEDAQHSDRASLRLDLEGGSGGLGRPAGRGSRRSSCRGSVRIGRCRASTIASPGRSGTSSRPRDRGDRPGGRGAVDSPTHAA